jgi:hypothetical protein
VDRTSQYQKKTYNKLEETNSKDQETCDQAQRNSRYVFLFVCLIQLNQIPVEEPSDIDEGEDEGAEQASTQYEPAEWTQLPVQNDTISSHISVPSANSPSPVISEPTRVC